MAQAGLTAMCVGTYERAVRIAAMALVMLAGSSAAACGHDEKDAIPNVRLGMAPRDVRDRFQPAGASSGVDPGAWQTALGAGDDTVLEWTARDPKTTFREARFEFHLGMLVAIRAKTAEKPAREEISTTPKTVTVRAPAAEGGAITVLARDCPTHKDEADAFAAKAPK